MKKVLIDTNDVIDYLLEKDPYFAEGKAVFAEIICGNVLGYITASMATDIFYFLQKEKGKAFALNSLTDLLLILDILTVHRNDVYSALQSGWNDFEDALQATVAVQSGMNAIVTRNSKDYKNALNIDIVLPKDFIQYLED